MFSKEIIRMLLQDDESVNPQKSFFAEWVKDITLEVAELYTELDSLYARWSSGDLPVDIDSLTVDVLGRIEILERRKGYILSKEL